MKIALKRKKKYKEITNKLYKDEGNNDDNDYGSDGNSTLA